MSFEFASLQSAWLASGEAEKTFRKSVRWASKPVGLNQRKPNPVSEVPHTPLAGPIRGDLVFYASFLGLGASAPS
jgi:hypothetical protein